MRSRLISLAYRMTTLYVRLLEQTPRRGVATWRHTTYLWTWATPDQSIQVIITNPPRPVIRCLSHGGWQLIFPYTVMWCRLCESWCRLVCLMLLIYCCRNFTKWKFRSACWTVPFVHYVWRCACVFVCLCPPDHNSRPTSAKLHASVWHQSGE